MRRETRIYPGCCRSAVCGRIECSGCDCLPVLLEFKRWVAEHRAVVLDPVWCPTVYTVPEPYCQAQYERPE